MMGCSEQANETIPSLKREDFLDCFLRIDSTPWISYNKGGSVHGIKSTNLNKRGYV
jgi:hypothetical protein